MRILLFSFFLLFGIQSYAQTTVKKVVLQAYWWDYHNNAYQSKWCNYLTELAPRLREMGIDAVWIPPQSKNSSTASVGYAPFDHYDLGDKYQKGATTTRMGTKDEYLRMIAVLHANGIEVIQDVVLNHINAAGSTSGEGGQDPNSFSMANNSGFKNFRYVCYETPGTSQTQTSYWARKGRWPKNFTNFYPNPNNNCTTGDICSPYFGADISYEDNAIGLSSNITGTTGYNPSQASGYMRNEGRNWMMWHRKQTAVDGYRWDAVKHFPTYVQEDYSWNLKYGVPSWAQGGKTMFNVGEWVGSKSELDAYTNAITAPTGEFMMGSFDFGLRAFDGGGGLYGMVYGQGGFNMASLPGAQQNNRVASYPLDNLFVHRTVTFVNNHDTFRPILGSTGNYTGWNTNQELSGHITPTEPRLSAAYASICAMDGNPQLFFEDLFDIGSNGNRWNHDPKSTTSLPARADIVNLIQCHQALGFKDGAYQVPFSSADYLIIARAGKAVIGITDSWDQWQTQNVQTSFAEGTILKDYSGASATTVTVGSGGMANITTPPVNPALNTAGRKGYCVWAPTGQSLTYVPTRLETTTQEWEMADDLGDSHVSSLGQGGSLPANSINWRIAGKIYVQSGKTITYIVYPGNPLKALYAGLFTTAGTQLSFKQGVGTLTGTYTPTFTGWVVIKVRNRLATTPKQKCWVNVTYTAPKVITNANSLSANNTASIWSGNGNTSNWKQPENWEEGMVPTAESYVVIPANVQPSPVLTEAAEISRIFVEKDAKLTLLAPLTIQNETVLEGQIVDQQFSQNPNESLSQFFIYPNPTTDGKVQVQTMWSNESRAFSTKIYSVEGQVLIEPKGTLSQISDQVSTWLTNQPAGVYLLQIEEQTLRIVRK
jgi:Alpha amylase, catalytic domain/Secretion system C-terminal sorting domain/Domain of unknown function (DUF1939)